MMFRGEISVMLTIPIRLKVRSIGLGGKKVSACEPLIPGIEASSKYYRTQPRFGGAFLFHARIPVAGSRGGPASKTRTDIPLTHSRELRFGIGLE
jgi:hypothetical protein